MVCEIVTAFLFLHKRFSFFFPLGLLFPKPSLDQMQITLLQTAPFYFALHQVMGKHRFKGRDVPENVQ